MKYTNKHIQFFLHCWYAAYNGAYDGIIGEQTKAAIKKFQKDKDLVVDGIWGAKTEQAAISWVTTVEIWLWKNRYMQNYSDVNGVPWVAYERAFWEWEDAHKLPRTAVMTSEKLKMFQQEDLPDVQNYEVWGMDKTHIRAAWKQVKGLTAYIYKTDEYGNLPKKYFATSDGKYYTFDNCSPGQRIYVRVRFGKKINGCKCWSRYTDVDYGQTESESHFKPEEFYCECGARKTMDSTLLSNLEKLRSHFGDRPITITSGYRCKECNDKSPGSIPNSKHIYGKAVDLYIPGITDSLSGRKQVINYWMTLPKANYSYCNGYNSYGEYVDAPYMGNAVHCDVN